MTTGNKGNGQNHGNSLHAPPLPTLPFDLVTEILCWLPVKHLIQLRRVCKSWNSLISDDSKFAKRHLRLSISNQDHHHLILTPKATSDEFVLYDYRLSSIFSSESTPSVSQLWFPFIPIINGDSFGGFSTCHGIFCFGIDGSLALLCNPSIGKLKLLPPLKNICNLKTSYTLVYDPFIDNYKIIALSYNHTVNVHTLGTDYWKRIQDVPYHYHIHGLGILVGVFVGGTVNWLAYDSCSSSWVIVSLDLEKESYRRLLQPLEQFDPNIVFGELRGCLCILSSHHNLSDIWIMKEYGNEQSWTKLLSVPQTETHHGFLYPYTKPVYISEDDQVMLKRPEMGGFDLVVYDSITNTLKTLEIENLDGWMEPNIYVESLISPSC